MNKLSHKLAEIALEIKAIRLNPQNPFTWTSGYRMPIYNDNRLLLGSFEHRSLVADGFLALIEKEKLKFDIVAGTATAGIPFGTTLADRLRLPFVYVREKPKAHGAGKRIEGVWNPGQRVLLVEDLISMGTSSTSAIQGIRAEGGLLDSCVAIFTYEFEAARQAFEAVQARYHALLGFSELLEVARECTYISESEYTLLSTWSKDPMAWGERNGFPSVNR